MTVENVLVQGWPWRTTVAAQWYGEASLPDGGTYAPKGVHIIEMSWGKIDSLTVYTDSAKTSAMLDSLAAQGIEEAAAAPIEK